MTFDSMAEFVNAEKVDRGFLSRNVYPSFLSVCSVLQRLNMKSRLAKHAVGALFLAALLLTIGVDARAQDDEWRTLNSEAMSLYQKGQYDRALSVGLEALEVAEKEKGPNHPDTATSLNRLALIYKSQGKYGQAEPLFKRSLAVREKALGPDHPDVASSATRAIGRHGPGYAFGNPPNSDVAQLTGWVSQE
jgi:tetratricopeptide (TPR) repeat protein